MTLVKSKFFNIAIGIILVLLICFLLIKVAPILKVLADIIMTIIIPLCISVVFYYISRPFRELMERKKIPRIISITFIFILIYLCISFIIIFLWPYVEAQIASFTQESPKEKILELE